MLKLARLKKSIGLLTTGVFPLVFCTACNKISQYSLPVIYGSFNNDLYTQTKTGFSFDNDNITGVLNQQLTVGGKNYASEKNTLSTYLPQQTVIKQDLNLNEVYAQPSNVDGWDKTHSADWQPNSYSFDWYTPSDTKLTSAEKISDVSMDSANKDFNKSYSVLVSPKNWNISVMGQNNAIIGQAVSSYAQAMLSFISQTGIISRDDSGVENILNTIFGSTYNTSQKQAFYELMCDYNNVIDVGNGNAKFTLSSQLFNYLSSPYIVDLSDKSTHVEWEYKGQDDFGGKPLKFSDLYDASNNCIKQTWIGDVSTKNASYKAMYTGYTQPTSVTDGRSLDDTLLAPTVWGAAVPVIINPTISKFNYYNPIKNHGINQNDYFTNNINDVDGLVKKSKAWKNVYSKHGLGNPAPTNLSYQVKNNALTSSSTTFTQDKFNDVANDINTNVWKPMFYTPSSSGGSTNASGGYVPSILTGGTGGSPDTLASVASDNSFVAFFNLSWVGFPKANLDPQNNKTLDYAYVPFLGSLAADPKTNMPAVFPIHLFMNNTNDGFDKDVITDSLIPAAQTLLQCSKPDSKDPIIPKDKQVAFKDNPINKCFYFDISKLAKKQTDVLKYLNNNSISLNDNLPASGTGQLAIDTIKSLYDSQDWADFINGSSSV